MLLYWLYHRCLELLVTVLLVIKISWSWRLPVILQVYFCPESPRWLISKCREVEAKEILTSYHANNLSDDELVEMEFKEILASKYPCRKG